MGFILPRSGFVHINGHIDLTKTVGGGVHIFNVSPALRWMLAIWLLTRRYTWPPNTSCLLARRARRQVSLVVIFFASLECIV